MEEITLQALLEAGCHFGHKSERWHPKAAEFIYTEKDGVHIIDLAKTKAGLEAAVTFVGDLAREGKTVLFVATKRQAQGVVKELAEKAGASYLVERWIGGFLTNWDEIHKNIQKINRLSEEEKTGGWKKFPKHERTHLARYLSRLKIFYGGVLMLDEPPAALFVVDIRKESAAVAEAIRREIPIIAIVDTNADPAGIDYVIPANDDAVGSIEYITRALARAYQEGRGKAEKEAARARPVSPAGPEKSQEQTEEHMVSSASKPSETEKAQQKGTIEEKKDVSEPKKKEIAKKPVKSK